jgi:hypothetical protein
MAKLIYRQSDLPPYDSDYMQRLAYHLWQYKLYWHDARRPLEVKWRECDEAYLCYRRLPSTGGMDWVDDSEFGETDIFDNVNLLSLRMSLALMPRDYRWLTVSSRADEAQELIQAIQDQQIFMHRKARTRRAFSRVIKQNIVRGTTACFWTWRENTRYRRLSSTETRPMLRKHLKALGADPKDINKVIQARIPEVTFSGPQIRPLDVFDLWIDPHLDMTNTAYPATIVQTFNFLPDIQDAVDDMGQPLYQNTDGLNPFSVEQIYAWDNNFRMRAPEVIGVFPMFGTYPARVTGFTKLVPVYIFHMPYLKFEGEEFFDTYFHLAINNGFRWPRIIRIEENPSDSGHPHVLIDNYIDWFTNIGYGIGGVEKALTYYRQKNLLQAIMMNAATATQFPAQMIYADAFRDDQEVNFSPGALNEIAHTPLGLDVVRPVPMPATGMQLAMQDMRFWADEIRSKMGVDGLAIDNPARSISKSKTATEVNADASTGSTMLDDFIEKFSDMLSDLCQGVYESSRKNLRPDAEGNLVFEKALADRVQQVSIPWRQFDVDRTIQVNGYLGALNKAQEMQNMIQAAQMTQEMAQALPNAQAVLQKLWGEILERLNIPLSPQEMMSPQQIAMNDPQVQMGAAQAALANPQIVQAILEQQHKARQLNFDQQQMQQQQQQVPPNVQTGPPAGNPGTQTLPPQGF